jgi:hypothetical protein
MLTYRSVRENGNYNTFQLVRPIPLAMRPLLLDETYVLGLMGKAMTLVGLLVGGVLAVIFVKLLQPLRTNAGVPQPRDAFSVGCGVVVGILLLIVVVFLFSIN